MTRNGHAMRPYPSGDRGKTSVLVRDRLPTIRSDTVAQRVGDPFTPALASFGDRVDCGHGRWHEHREQDEKKTMAIENMGVLSFLRRGGSVNFRLASRGKIR